MIRYTLKTADIHAKNIVCFIETCTDLGVIDFLNLDVHILSDIQKKAKQKKSGIYEYFLGVKSYEKLYICVSKEENYEGHVRVLGKYLPKLPNNICLITDTTENKKMLLEVSELSRYKFQRYKSEKKEKSSEIVCTKEEKKALSCLESTLSDICLARDLGETPASDLTPEIFSDIVKKTKFKNIKVKVLTYQDIVKKGLGLIEGVGKGSSNKPCMVILEHIKDKKAPIAGIVGKGVTFDTGGNQIKPGDYMYDMKGDMGGAAVVFGLMKNLDRQDIDKNIVACLCLAENVVSSNAYKPSDILTGYTGKTVEIVHTDAEGRLVLADGMSYLGKNYKTTSMMSVATLTGAVIAALGFRYAGVMGTDEEMIEKITEYSKSHTEKYVRLPLDENLIEKTKSEIADFKNLDRTVHAGSSLGAAFLSNFLENKELYTHIDIAGSYINEGEAYGKMPKGMTGFGVESLSEIFSS